MAPRSASRPTGTVGRNGGRISQRDTGTSYLLQNGDGTLGVIRRLGAAVVWDPGFQSAFPGEAAAMAGLEEPRIAAPERYVVDATGRIVSVVRRFFESAPLDGLLAGHPRGLDAQTAAVVVGDVLTALCALHHQGVPHRGVGAEQVLVGADGVCVLVDAGLSARPWSPDIASPDQGSTELEEASARERLAAMADDLVAAADLFADCLTPDRPAAALLPLPGDAPAPDGTPGAVPNPWPNAVPNALPTAEPDRLSAVLAGAKEPRSNGPSTAAELLAAFTSATRSFDPGWDERSREQLAALVQESLQAPARFRDRVRLRWNRQPPPDPGSGPGPGGDPGGDPGSPAAGRRARARPTRRAEQHGPKHPGAADRTWIRAAILYAAMLAVVIVGVTAIALSGDDSPAPKTSQPPQPPAAPSQQPSQAVVGTATALMSASKVAAASTTAATATAVAAPAPVPSASHVHASPVASVTPSATSAGWSQQIFLWSDGWIDHYSIDSWAQSDLVLRNDLAVTALDVRVRIAVTPQLSYTGAWSTVPDESMVTTVTRQDGWLVYEFVLDAGVTMAPGSYEFAAQYDHAQGYRDTGADSYSIVAVAAGRRMEVSGGFSGDQRPPAQPPGGRSRRR
ncbi:protein kinase [Streptacidiphilus sp. N1-10]|uniref:Protein kinase n=1 Tax=Streptacidiphilus jeojiensis TaxID=3229225 RepID=A0ABV6XH59_9ACTN